MLKLYKKTDQGILYWEAWENNGKLTIHEGVIGEEGDTRETSILPKRSADETIEIESEIPLEHGYSEIPIEDHVELLIHYSTATWGSTEDLDQRHTVENLMNECLG